MLLRARSLGPLALGLCTVLSATSSSAPAVAATPDCRFGVNAHQASNAALDLAAAANIGWVRFDMNWLQFEPAKGDYNWSEADRFVDHAVGAGMHVFITIAYSPKWAVTGPCNDADGNDVNRCLNRPPTNVADWTDFVTAVVNRYQDRVTHFGMWNEPNLLHFFNGTRAQYVNDILIPGSNAVHTACATCKVVGPELAHLRGANWDANEGECIGNNCRFNGWNHSLKMILQDAGSYIDVISHHKYQQPADKFWAEAVDGEIIGIKIVDGIKEVTDQYAPGKPVWITEFGMESEPFGPHSNTDTATQVTLFYEGLDGIQNGTFSGATNQPWPELDKLFWYDLSDDPNGYSWGLLDSDLSPKPGYDAYKNVITSLGICDGSSGSGGGTTGSGGAGGGDSSSGAGSSGGGTGSGGAGAGSTGSAGSGGDNASDTTEESSGACTTGQGSDHRSLWLMLALALASAARRRPKR